MTTTRALIALGSNLGDRGEQISQAIAQLDQLTGVRVIARSTLHETAPVGGPPGQPNFLNAAVTVETNLAALELLAALRGIEQHFGRQRTVHWGARTLDLDLLLYGEAIVELPELVVPHPRMSFRRFVLAPAIEIAATWQHPTTGWTLGQLWRHLHDSPRSIVLVTNDEPLGREVLSGVETQCRALAELATWQLALRPGAWRPDGLHPRLIVTLDEIPCVKRGGPSLHLNSGEVASAVHEIVAAIQASQD